MTGEERVCLFYLYIIYRLGPPPEEKMVPCRYYTRVPLWIRSSVDAAFHRQIPPVTEATMVRRDTMRNASLHCGNRVRSIVETPQTETLSAPTVFKNQ